MIIKQGIDIIAIARIEKVYKKYGNIFLNKVFSKSEQELFTSQNYNINFLAKRFAAKEAFAKALGTGFNNGLKLKDISTLNNSKGSPFIKLSTNVKNTLLQEYNTYDISVSLSDEKEYAIASIIVFAYN